MRGGSGVSAYRVDLEALKNAVCALEDILEHHEALQGVPDAHNTYAARTALRQVITECELALAKELRGNQ
jgi:hypothetical protein